MSKIRLAVISDLHCGHYGGLTPPKWQIREARRPKLYDLQKESWELFEAFRNATIQTRRKLVLLVNGDCIDGNMHPNECIVSDRYEQCKMAEEVILGFKSPQIIMTRGTASHVGKEEDWEDTIACTVRGDIRSEQFINIDGFNIYARHKIGRSGVPHGRNTAPSREQVWNFLKSSSGICPKADILIFSHVHYCVGNFVFMGDKKIQSITTPALQTVSQYGIKECSGEVHFGMIYFDFDDGKLVNQVELIESVNSAKPKEIKV